MRSANYANQTATFTPLEPQHMVRAAIVHGMNPKYPEPERQRYRRLLKGHLNYDESLIDNLFRLIGRRPRSVKEAVRLDGLLQDVAYNSKTWKALEYESLKKEGVIVPYSGDAKGLVHKINETAESKVIFVQNKPWADADYLKHVPNDSMLVLNGPDVVAKFAWEKGFALPDHYLKNGRLTEDVLGLLAEHRFAFNEALRTAIGLLKEPKYANRNISLWIIKNPNGQQYRMYPHDFVEAAETASYFSRFGKEAVQELGDLANEGKYHGLNVFLVPKRLAQNGESYNTVAMHYLPVVDRRAKRALEWMNFVGICDCSSAYDRRNFEHREGKAAYVTNGSDVHVNFAILDIQKRKRINPNSNPNNLSPLPTPELVRFVDMIKKNLAFESKVENGDRQKTERRRVDQTGIDILINELAKDWSHDLMFGPGIRLRDFVFRPMY